MQKHPRRHGKTSRWMVYPTLLLTLALFSPSGQTYAQQTPIQGKEAQAAGAAKGEPVFALSEQALIDLAQQDHPRQEQLRATRIAAQLNKTAFAEKFQPHLYTTGAYSRTLQPALLPGQPIVSPVFQFGVGVKQNLRSGLSTQFEAYSTQQSIDQLGDQDGPSPFPVVKDATRVGLSAQLRLDLWKNRWGKLDRLEQTRLGELDKSAALERRLEQVAFTMDVRKIYWSLVANQASQDTQAKLLAGARKQLSSIERQARAYIADDADVARYEALVETFVGNQRALELEWVQLSSALKAMLPALKRQKLQLAQADIDRTSQQVVACTLKVASYQTPPVDKSSWSAWLEHVEERRQAEAGLNASYTQPDLHVSAGLNVGGQEEGFGSGVGELFSDPKPQWQLALELNIPLGSAKSQTQRLKEQLEVATWQAQSLAVRAQLEAEHESSLQLINLLNLTLKTQENIRKSNEKKLSLAQTKFRQARIPLAILIEDENSVFASSIDEIRTKLGVIHTLLDYFKTFDQIECALNDQSRPGV